MEDGLVLTTNATFDGFIRVLILIVVEDSLVQYDTYIDDSWMES